MVSLMTTTARDVAAALRRRIPGLPVKKLHKLLYYCQGHHLATFGVPLFGESVMAWDMGPVVGQLWHEEKTDGAGQPADGALDEAQLNTVGYVVSRYGALTGLDLEHLTHAESPWQRADEDRTPGTSARIETAWIADYFLRADAGDDEGEPVLDSDVVRAWLAGADERRTDSRPVDDLGEIQRRLADLA